MGKIKKGILGGFSGRVGNVIGGSWKGIDYMRSEATSISDPKTAKQLEQRSKFRVAVEFAKNCVPLINVGLKQYATKRSEFNYLVSKICKDYWNDAGNEINYSLVQLSAGELLVPNLEEWVFETEGEQQIQCLQLNFVEDFPPERANDICFALCYDVNSASFFGSYYGSQPLRSDAYVELVVPHYDPPYEYYVYSFYQDPLTGECSDTLVTHIVVS